MREFGLFLRVENLAMLKCHFDESGGTGASPVLVVAGFCGGCQQWDFFSGEWLDILAKYDLQSPFKMQHFDRRKEQFRHFPEEKRKQLLGELLGVIERRAMMAVGSVISLPDYKELITGTAKQKIGSAYNLAVAGCFWAIGKWAQNYNWNEEIGYVFDEGHKNAAEALETHKKHLAAEGFRAQYRLGPIAFHSDTQVVPLQAADLFAYESWRRCTEEAVRILNGPGQLTVENVRYPIRRLFSSGMKMSVHFIGRDALVDLRDRNS